MNFDIAGFYDDDYEDEMSFGGNMSGGRMGMNNMGGGGTVPWSYNWSRSYQTQCANVL